MRAIVRRGYISLRTVFTVLFSVSILWLAASGTVFAHAKVLSATPGINSTVAQAPTTITVITAENMVPNPSVSNLFVYAPDGALISTGNGKVALNNPEQMSVNIKPEKDGIYVVRWITQSAEDGDKAEGAFVFTVKANAASSATNNNPSTPSPTVTTPTTNNNNAWLPAIITGIVTLLIGLGAGFGIGRTRNTTTKQSVVSQAEQ